MQNSNNVSEDYVETAVAIPEVVEAFKKAGYKGYLSSEYEGGEHLRADMEETVLSRYAVIRKQ